MRPFVFAWESNERDHTGQRIVKWRICLPWKSSDRWTKGVYLTKDAATKALTKYIYTTDN